jgi:hypothetical protein
MSKIDDGGPAFGHAAENGHCCGMKLRDWFAGMAMQGAVSDGVLRQIAKVCSDPAGMVKIIATDSYAIADAMIAEKRRTESPQ